MKTERGFSSRGGATTGAPLIVVFDGSNSTEDSPLASRLMRICGPDIKQIAVIDAEGEGFYRGIPGLGDTIEATVEAFKAKIEELSPGRIVAVGSGIGGHAALVYGVLLGVSRIVAIEPVAHLVEKDLEAFHDHRWRSELARLPDPSIARRFALPDLMSRVDYSGEAHILFGTHRPTDHLDNVHLNLIHAQWLARSPRVILHPFATIVPGMGARLLDQNEATALASRLLLDPEPSSPPAPIRFGEVANVDPGQRPLVYTTKLTVCRIEEENPANKTGGPVSFGAAGEVDASTTRKMDDGLRSWIVENLLLDAAPKDLVNQLLPRGISSRETLMEIDLARFHPYYLATKRLVNRIKKRDWLLTTYRRLDRMRRRPMEIERRDTITRDDFVKAYASTGRPVLISGLVHWPALTRWERGELARRLGTWDVALTASASDSDQISPLESTTFAEFLEELGAGSLGPSLTLDLDDTSVDRGLREELQRDLQPLPEWFFRRDPPKGTIWFGPEGSRPRSPSETTAYLVVQVVGQVRVRLLLSWDVDLVEKELRAAPAPEYRPIPGVHFPPLDRPEILDFALKPGEILYLPPGCRARFECVEPSAMVRFSPVTPDA